MGKKTMLLKLAREVLRRKGYGRQYGYVQRGRKRRPRSVKGKLFDFILKRIERSLLGSRRR